MEDVRVEDGVGGAGGEVFCVGWEGLEEEDHFVCWGWVGLGWIDGWEEE